MTSHSPTLALLAENLRAAAMVATSALESSDALADRFPVMPDTLKTLPTRDKLMLYGLLKMVESLQDLLGGRIFRGLLAAGGVDLTGLLPRDIANRMEALGVVDNALSWRSVNDLRNRLAHEYPLDQKRQTALLNEAYAAIPYLTMTVERATAVARSRFPEIIPLLCVEGDAP